MKIFKELQRRNVFRVAIGYVVSTWLLVQVADLVLENIGAPDWVMQTIMLIMALGFPVVVFFSWAYEVTPEGIKRESEVARDESITHLTGHKLDRAIIAVLVVALAYFIWESRFSGGDETQLDDAQTPPEPVLAEPDTVSAPAAETGLPKLDRSIAVLPFVNMSADEEQEYFSDGLTEEILNRLAQLPELRVAGRTSSFKYKDKNLDLREIAAELGVSHLLEGSVRRSGDQVRITAQLIRADDGGHLWSQTYDRTIEDVLAVQDEIAERVANGLDVMLDDFSRNRMRNVGVPNVEAFIAYQKAWEIFVAAHDSDDLLGGLARANEYFRQATEMYPGFGMAWYWQADLYQHILLDPRSGEEELKQAARLNQELLVAATEHAQTAQQRAFSELSRVIFSDDWTGARIAAERAINAQTCLGPNWSEILAPFGLAEQFIRESDIYLECQGGTLRSAVAYARRVEALLINGRYADALESADTAIAQLGRSDYTSLLRVLALTTLGRTKEALDEARLISPDNRRASHWVAILLVMTGDSTAAEPLAAQYLALDSHLPQKLALLKYLGRQAELDAMAAELDAKPGGHVVLALAHLDCMCGPLFDLDRTPNFKTRLKEGQLDWPPVKVIDPAIRD